MLLTNLMYWYVFTTSCRCFYVAKSYSVAGMRAEAYALYCRARNLADDALKKIQMLDGDNKVILIFCFPGSDWGNWTPHWSIIVLHYGLLQ